MFRYHLFYNCPSQIVIYGAIYNTDHELGPVCLLHQANEKQLPCITVCPVPGFKKKGFHFDHRSFDDNAFNLGDFFVDGAVARLNNASEFRLKNIRTMFHGNCFTICSLRKWPKKWGPVLRMKTRCRIAISI